MNVFKDTMESILKETKKTHAKVEETKDILNVLQTDRDKTTDSFIFQKGNNYSSFQNPFTDEEEEYHKGGPGVLPQHIILSQECQHDHSVYQPSGAHSQHSSFY